MLRLVSLERIRIPSDACGQTNSISICYVWTGRFLNPEIKSCGIKNTCGQGLIVKTVRANQVEINQSETAVSNSDQCDFDLQLTLFSVARYDQACPFSLISL